MTLDSLREQLAQVEADLARLAPPEDALAKAFPLGRVGFRRETPRQQRRTDAATERSVDRAVKVTGLCKRRDQLRAAIHDIESGAAARRDAHKAAAAARVRAAQVGDVVTDSIYGICTVVRVNTRGLTVQTLSGYREARPWDLLVDAARVTR